MDFHLLLSAGLPGASDTLLNPHMLSDEPLAWQVVFGGKVKCHRNLRNPDPLRDSATSIND
jgi:hypothetical protein